jgi:nucleoside-diphosphate-sugar epimerase
VVEWTLVTGATGFVGGEWTLKALLRGEYVAALVRPGREQAVVSHLNKLADSHACERPSVDKLVVVPWAPGSEFSSFQLLRQSGVEKIKAVIHAAADMAYSLNKLPRSLETNLGMALGLYNAVAEHAPETKKFISVSTAYTCGLNPLEVIPEALHLTPRLVNGYQTSKWATEMSLTERARQGGPKLCILRPSIVVGESGRGIYTGKCFGFYMFLRAFALAKKAGAKKMKVNIRPEAEINLLPIDQLLVLIDRLSVNETEGFVHASMDRGVTVGFMMKSIGAIYGFPIEEGKPRTIPEHIFDRQVQANMAFANKTFRFQNATAKSIVPESNWEDFNVESFEKVVRQSKALYFKKARFERSDLDVLPQMIPGQLRQVVSLGAKLKKQLTR